MNERVSHGDEKLSRVLERIRKKTIYSEKDFKSPYQILQRSIVLSRNRDRDPDSFLRETTILFSGFSRTGKTSDIDVNDLIATLFVLRDNPDKTKYRFPDLVKQEEISLLIESLLGKNLDFVSGKKKSSIILPAYLILRSLKENNSIWNFSFYYEKDACQQAVMLKNILLNSIHTKSASLALKKRFQQSLDIEEKEVRTRTPEKKQILILPKYSNVNLKGSLPYSSPDKFSDTYIQKIRSAQEDSDILSDERIFMDLIFKYGAMTIDKNGLISLEKKSLKSILEGMKNDNDLEKLFSSLKSILGSKNMVSLVSSASLITSYSDDTRPDSASWFFAEHKNPQHVAKLIGAFNDTLTSLFKNIEKGNNVELEKAVEKNSQFDFSKTNYQIASKLYKCYFGKSNPLNDKLVEFLKFPGVDSAIMSLRKLSLIRVLQKNLIEMNYDKEKFVNPYFIPSGDDVGEDLNSHYFKMIDLAEGKLDVVGLGDLTQVDIIKQLGYFTVEKYLQNNRKDLNGNNRIRAIEYPNGRLVLLIPDGLMPEKRNIINPAGFPLPIETDFIVAKNKLEVYFNDVDLGDIPVEVENIS